MLKRGIDNDFVLFQKPNESLHLFGFGSISAPCAAPQ